ncbi:MAG: ABC transporter ATP-binding protein [Candidatus Rokuibacteriota bacterium]
MTAPTAPARGADVEVRGLTKRFGEVTAVDAVTFAVRGGEFFSLLGPSGCGKTTTLRAIGGFEAVDAGDVLIGGRAMGRLPPNRRETNMVFQRLALFPHYTARDNVAFGLRMKRLPDVEVRRRVDEALELVRLPGLGARRINELSGGQQQRVALARALVNRPRVLLLDEPLSALDLKLRLQLQEELKRLQRDTGATFVYVTHDQGEALAMSDRLGVMEAGRLAQVGPPLEIYERPSTRFVAAFIGDANLIDGVAEGIEGDTVLVRAGALALRARRLGWERAGQAVAVCVRPERVRVDTTLDLATMLPGRVEDRAFSGSLVKYRLAAGGLRLHAAVPYRNGLPLFPVGADVMAGWEASQAVVVA